MKSLSLLLIFFVTGSHLCGQAARMPAHTRAAIEAIQKNLLNNRSIPSQNVIDFYPIYKTNGRYYIAALAKVNSSFDKERAIQDGLDVGAVIGKIASIRIPLHIFNADFYYPGVEYIEVAEKITPELDQALIDVRADLVHQGAGLPQPFTGKDVLIGIVDWGFDYTHPMFFDTALQQTRIMAAWDQVKIIGTPPSGFSHGALYSDPEQLALAGGDTFSIIHDYHGTHVAGIAGGSGGGTAYRGIGFESNFLFSQMRQDASSSLDAFQWMYDMSQAAGRRLVINNSWGGYRTNPLDGTSLLSQAIDGFTDLGVVFVFSAGNNGNTSFHLRKTFNQDSVKTRIGGFNYTGDDELWGQTISMWGEAGHPFAVKLQILSDSNKVIAETELMRTDSSPSFTDTFLIIGPDTVFYNFIIDAAHPLNSRPQVTLNVKSENQDLKKIIYAEAGSGTVHFWNTRLTIYGGGNWGSGFFAPTAEYTNGDKNFGIGHPAVTTNVITTAAHRTGFSLTSFSSYGPRMDGFLKPDISAPGENIVSAFNSFAVENPTPVTVIDFNGKSYEFIRLSGTSMSAPMVTGVVSLLLEADPSLSVSEIKGILLENARTDASTGSIGPEGHERWGHGKLDAYEAILDITGVSASNDINTIPYYLYPNPAHDKIYLLGELHGKENYKLISLDGIAVSSGPFTGSLELTSLMDGIYILNIESEKGVMSFKVVVKE